MKFKPSGLPLQPEAWQMYVSNIVGSRLITYNPSELRIQDITEEQKALLERDFSTKTINFKREKYIAGGLSVGGVALAAAMLTETVPSYVTTPTILALTAIVFGNAYRNVKRSQEMRSQHDLRRQLFAQDDGVRIPQMPVRMHLPMDVLDNEVPFHTEFGEMNMSAGTLLQSYVPMEYTQEVGEAFAERDQDAHFDFGTQPAGAVIHALEHLDPGEQHNFLNGAMPALTQISEAYKDLPGTDAQVQLFVGSLSLQQALAYQAGGQESGN